VQIGDILTHDGRRYVLLGFDPEGVTPRMIYVEDALTGAHRELPFEAVRMTEGPSFRLRVVRPPHSNE
jgi:hypothetical protein